MEREMWQKGMQGRLGAKSRGLEWQKYLICIYDIFKE